MNTRSKITIVTVALLCLTPLSCTSGTEDGGESQGEGESTGDGDGDGDPTTGDGDGDPGPGPLDGPFDAPNAPFCGTFSFYENLGPDYDTALAALDAQVAMTYDTYFLEATPIEGPVYDYYDNVVERDFWVITILDQEGGTILQSLNDILDSEGNHYWIEWCPD